MHDCKRGTPLVMLHSRTTIWRAWTARVTTGASVLALSLCGTTNTCAQQSLVEKVTDSSQPAVVPNESLPADTKPREFIGVDPKTGERFPIRFLEKRGPRFIDSRQAGELKIGGTKGRSPLSGTVRAFVGLDPNTGKINRIQFLDIGQPMFNNTRKAGELETGRTNVSPLSGTVRAFVGLDSNTGEVTRIKYLETGTTLQFKAPGKQDKLPVDTLEQFRRFKAQGVSGKGRDNSLKQTGQSQAPNTSSANTPGKQNGGHIVDLLIEPIHKR